MSWRVRDSVISLTLFSLVPAGLILLVSALNNLPFSPERGAAIWAGSFLFVLVSWAGLPFRIVGGLAALPWAAVLIILCGALGLAAYLAFPATGLAWLWTAALALLLIWVEAAIRAGLSRPFPLLARMLSSLLFAGLFGFLVTGFWMVENRFSDEEFFVAVQAAVLAVLWWVFQAAANSSCRGSANWLYRQPTAFSEQSFLTYTCDQSRLPLILLPAKRTSLVLSALTGLIAAGGLVWAGAHYQASFYPEIVSPPFPGISSDNPLRCGETSPDTAVFDGVDVWRRLIDRVEANPEKGAPEYGMLALATGEATWAVQFHDALLSEARRGVYTGPAHSVKIGQYLAALRAYYFPLVRDAFPELFSPGEQREIHSWFSAVNRRALTVEWVDWMYGLAFKRFPGGLYENQENGAGLLALLESAGLGDPALSQANRDYLDRNLRGWQARFRNTDDAITYQPIWINNALFQSLYTGSTNSHNERLAFEWLLAQSLPQGGELQYNHPQPTSLAGSAYLGAGRLNDGRLMWLAGKGIEVLEAQDGYLQAQPGIERPVELQGLSPDTGSCLIYGDSGLPNQVGPLAPDKLVVRTGWGDEAGYLLLNLRFTGWHRYKGTNTLTLFFHEQALVSDRLAGARIAWLPYGRSHVRDKRIARENLNGLSVERTGISRVIYELTGMGSRWEQDPPYYADVIEFREEDEVTYAWTAISDWHGWRHDRHIYAAHSGLVAVVDRFSSTREGGASLFWHVRGETAAPDRIRLGSPANGDELLLVTENSQHVLIRRHPAGQNSPALEIEVPVSSASSDRLITLFLTGEWAGAEARVQGEGASQFLLVEKGEQSMRIPLHPEVVQP